MAAEDPDHRKLCTLCNTPRNVLVRCQIDSSGKWHFVCTGACWEQVSGGVVDGDHKKEHQFYRYGGMWKNKHEGASAKMPRKVKEKQKEKKKQVQQDTNVEQQTPRD